MEFDLKYLSAEPDRHGNMRLYARRYGRRIRIRVARDDPAFLETYQKALATLAELPNAAEPPSNTAKKKIAVRGTLGWLASLYFGSDEFRGLQSGPTRRAVIEDCLRETVREGSTDVMADCPLSYLTPAKIKRLRDLKKGLPGAANNRRKYLSAMFGWAVEEGHLTHNPARDVRRVKYARKGFHTWTVAEVCKYAEGHPIGTKPYLALCLLLFTGTRSGDMIRLGPQHVHGDCIAFVPRKTRHVRADESVKPLLPPLAAAIKAGPIGKISFLETQYGKRFSDKGIGNAMRQWCDEAGLPRCTAHGLRKAAATILAELGATDQQLMAVFDWTTSAQAKVYTEAANRKRMANDAMPLLSHFSRAMDGSGTLPEPSFVAPNAPALSHRS